MNNKIFRINHLFWYVTISLLLCESLFGNKILVPTDSLTIQGGINGCSNGDTVLIDPGVYHETINYLGKNILVTSKYILTGDTTYISRTVINGDSSGSVVSFLNQEDIVNSEGSDTITSSILI